MAKVLVLYYSSYGHIETMAQAVAEGARAAGATATVKRVPETAPPEVAKSAHFKLDQPAPIATINELPDYDAIIVGCPTRFGRMPSQMASFLDQAGGLWARGALHGCRVYFHCHTAWWAGSNIIFRHYQSTAFRYGRRWSSLQFSGTDDIG